MNIYNVYIYFKVKDENIMIFKPVYFQSIYFKTICLLCPPSLTRAQPTEKLGCSLVQSNFKVFHQPERQTHDWVTRSVTGCFIENRSNSNM